MLEQRLGLTIPAVQILMCCVVALRTGPGEDHADGADDDLKIKPKTPVLDVR